MKNVNEEYVKVFDALCACQRHCCEDCPFKEDDHCLTGAYNIFMKAAMLLEAMHDWLLDNHLWDDFVRDTEGTQMEPLDWSERLHKYAEETHKDAETSADATHPDHPVTDATHPDHYNSGGIQCWDAMEAAWGAEAVQNFCVCNAMKYIWRQDRKNGREDVEKAIVYLRKWIELEEKC